MAKQINPPVLLQIQKHDDTIRRVLISIQAKIYDEKFLTISHPSQQNDIEWISLIRGINEILYLRHRTVHILMENDEMVNSILNNELKEKSLYTKYHYLSFKTSLAKTEWTGICAVPQIYEEKCEVK